MPNLKEIAQTTVSEIERMLNAKSVVGEPITLNGATVIPLVSLGFGFGAGAGEGKSEKTGVGEGGGTGGGGGIKPVAVIVSTADGVKVVPTRPGASGMVEKIAESIAKIRTAKAENESAEG